MVVCERVGQSGAIRSRIPWAHLGGKSQRETGLEQYLIFGSKLSSDRNRWMIRGVYMGRARASRAMRAVEWNYMFLGKYFSEGFDRERVPERGDGGLLT